MDSFSTRLKVWLNANESNRRGALFLGIVVLFTSGLASGRLLLCLIGFALIAEGIAMLIASAPERAPQQPPRLR